MPRHHFLEKLRGACRKLRAPIGNGLPQRRRQFAGRGIIGNRAYVRLHPLAKLLPGRRFARSAGNCPSPASAGNPIPPPETLPPPAPHPHESPSTNPERARVSPCPH